MSGIPVAIAFLNLSRVSSFSVASFTISQDTVLDVTYRVFPASACIPMSSARFSSWFGPVLVGYLDTASGPLFFAPEMCCIEKLYGRVFSLRLRSLLFVISVSDRSFRIWLRGLWSVVTIRFGHPRMFGAVHMLLPRLLPLLGHTYFLPKW